MQIVYYMLTFAFLPSFFTLLMIGISPHLRSTAIPTQRLTLTLIPNQTLIVHPNFFLEVIPTPIPTLTQNRTQTTTFVFSSCNYCLN